MVYARPWLVLCRQRIRSGQLGTKSLVGVARHTAHMLQECRDSPGSEQRMLASGELPGTDFVS